MLQYLFAQDSAWGAYNKEGIPVFNCCWKCADIWGRIRPGQTIELCEDMGWGLLCQEENSNLLQALTQL